MGTKLRHIIYSVFLLFFIISFNTCYSAPPSATRPSAPARPTFEIVNNTGFTIVGLYISPVTNDTWGQNLLSRTMPNGNSTSWFLTESQLAGNAFDIRVVDSDGFTYTRANYRIRPNDRFVITINHADARYFREDFTPHFLWATGDGVGRDVSGIRRVGFATGEHTARNEILRLFKLYNRFWFSWDSTNHRDTRANYQAYINRQFNEYQRLNNPVQTRYYSWVRHWLSNNNRFAFAYISEVPDLRRGRFDWYRSVLVVIVNGDDVISMSFANIDPLGHSLPTSENNRTWLINNILNRFLN